MTFTLQEDDPAGNDTADTITTALPLDRETRARLVERSKAAVSQRQELIAQKAAKAAARDQVRTVAALTLPILLEHADHIQPCHGLQAQAHILAQVSRPTAQRDAARLLQPTTAAAARAEAVRTQDRHAQDSQYILHHQAPVRAHPAWLGGARM